MPRLWTDTIDSHRREVRDAVIDAAAKLVAERGLRGVTMSEIADATGIGRATLYKYFKSLDDVLVAWHERQVAGHLRELRDAAERGSGAGNRLEAVLHRYALITHETRQQHDAEIGALLHGDAHVARAREHLNGLVRALVEDAAAEGGIRDDVSADELSAYCLHALGAASGLQSKAAVRRLVSLTLAGLRSAS